MLSSLVCAIFCPRESSKLNWSQHLSSNRDDPKPDDNADKDRSYYLCHALAPARYVADRYDAPLYHWFSRTTDKALKQFSTSCLFRLRSEHRQCPQAKPL